MYVVIHGSLLAGYIPYGPFEDAEKAFNWAKLNLREGFEVFLMKSEL